LGKVILCGTPNDFDESERFCDEELFIGFEATADVDARRFK
jgi:hypothetical protein